MRVGEPDGSALDPMTARTQASEHACKRLLDLLACAVQIPMTQIVWTLLQKAVNYAVDYDLRLQADDCAVALAARHDGAVMAVVKALIGNDANSPERSLLALPGALGGCLLRMAAPSASNTP